MIGKQFDAEKMITKRKKRTEGTFHIPKDDSSQTDGLPLAEQSRQPKNRTAERIAEDYHLAHSTVEKYAVYSRALDSIGHLISCRGAQIGYYRFIGEGFLFLYAFSIII